ncbi:OmpA family protein [Variovorax sp.]|uniref:OmpA family protein n=1 Tax=Variovorax sp. TaxID=1871043 RepID=UPI002D5F6D1E|nr:OmpA family protein [Variovorax sp.]HYP83274.1 OmpA family protein [Variovorax sp.]
MNGRDGLNRIVGVCALLLAAGCSTPGTRVILLPQEDGSDSAVVVHAKGGDQLVSKPFQRASVGERSDKAPTLDQVDPEKVHRDNKALFDLVPPKPQTFILYFKVGGTVLTADSRRELDTVVAAALARSGADITVTGHTDTPGSTALNDELSMARATEIKALLVSRGFPANRIEAIGRGERDLRVPTGGNVYRQDNRRVVVVVR